MTCLQPKAVEVVGGIPQEILSRLDALASKLNVTVEHLWGVLVGQGPVHSWGLLASNAVFFLFGSLVPCLFFWGWKKLQAVKEDSDYSREPWEIFCCMVGLATVCVWVGIVVTLGSDIPSIITGFANPEAYAFDRVVQTFR